MKKFARNGGSIGTAGELFRRFPFISAVELPLGEKRGYIRVHVDGDVNFHLVHTPESELYPGQDDSVRFTPMDAPIFRFVLQVLDAAMENADRQAEQLRDAEEEVPEKKPPLIVAGERATEDLNRFALR